MTTLRPFHQLGVNQRWVLTQLARRNDGRWWPGCGWGYNSASDTARIMESLLRGGYVMRVHQPAPDPRKEYHITEQARAIVPKAQ